MSNALRLGDTVTGNYHGVSFTGTVGGYDGSGYVYIKFASPVTVYGVARDEVGIHPDSDERDSLRIIASAINPDVKPMSNAAGGGATLA